MEHFAAGDDERNDGTRGQQFAHVTSGADHLFEIVEDEKRGRAGCVELCDHGCERRFTGADACSQRLGNRTADVRGIADGSEWDKKHFLAEVWQELLSGSEREPCFAYPSRSREGYEPYSFVDDERSDSRQFFFATDQRRARRRQSRAAPAWRSGLGAGGEQRTQLVKQLSC